MPLSSLNADKLPLTLQGQQISTEWCADDQ
jgi:hypothetical protein